jgi:hypothetical protein
VTFESPQRVKDFCVQPHLRIKPEQHSEGDFGKQVKSIECRKPADE